MANHMFNYATQTVHRITVTHDNNGTERIYNTNHPSTSVPRSTRHILNNITSRPSDPDFRDLAEKRYRIIRY